MNGSISVYKSVSLRGCVAVTIHLCECVKLCVCERESEKEREGERELSLKVFGTLDM